MKSSAVLSLSLSARRSNLPVAAAVIIVMSIIIGMFLTDTTEEMVGYLLVTLVCAVPIALWIWGGALGIPIVPAVSGMYFVYFGLPIIRNDGTLTIFKPSEILTGAATVTLFLTAATIAWWLLVGQVHRSNDATPSLVSTRWLNRILFWGLASGILFHVSVYSGLGEWVGPAFGLFRSAMLSFAVSASFMVGHARALGLLQGRKWGLAVACLGIMILLAWLSFFLVGGMLYCLSAILGYFITAKRMPWRFLSAAIVVITILHAGKDHMREKYWSRNSNYSLTVTALDLPEKMGEWAEAGLTKIFSGEEYTSVVDRASLFALLLRVQRLVPDYVPYLDGASYAVLPQMLVPRFLDPDKIASQAGMAILNISAGFQTAEGASRTAIGWGLLAEAYFNFGYFGVIGVGLLFGFFCGALERWTVGAPIFSLPCLIAVSAMMQLISMELDAAGTVTAMFQSVVSVSIVFWLIKSLVKKKNRLSTMPAV